MDKTTRAKDPKRQERSKNLHETYLKRLKEDITKDNQISTSPPADNSAPSASSSMDNSTPSTSSSAGNSINRSDDTYIYGVGVCAVLGIVACVFFAYNSWNGCWNIFSNR